MPGFNLRKIMAGVTQEVSSSLPNRGESPKSFDSFGSIPVSERSMPAYIDLSGDPSASIIEASEALHQLRRNSFPFLLHLDSQSQDRSTIPEENRDGMRVETAAETVSSDIAQLPPIPIPQLIRTVKKDYDRPIDLNSPKDEPKGVSTGFVPSPISQDDLKKIQAMWLNAPQIASDIFYPEDKELGPAQGVDSSASLRRMTSKDYKHFYTSDFPKTELAASKTVQKGAAAGESTATLSRTDNYIILPSSSMKNTEDSRSCLRKLFSWFRFKFL